MNSEAKEQMLVVEWCRVTDWKAGKTTGLSRIFHVPNGGLRTKSEAAKLKAMGVVAGVADLMLPVMKVELGEGSLGAKITDATGRVICRVIAGLWIEMKADDGKLAPAQAEWGEEMLAAGYAWHCCKGAQEAIAAIRAYVGLPDDQ